MFASSLLEGTNNLLTALLHGAVRLDPASWSKGAALTASAGLETAPVACDQAADLHYARSTRGAPFSPRETAKQIMRGP